jgi:NADH kinase
VSPVDGRHVHENYPVNVIVETGVAEELEGELPFAFTPPEDGMSLIWGWLVDVDIHAELHRTVDAIITLGGDGTILHAASLFSSTYVPPILSFSLGTLGFLLPFSTYPSPQPGPPLVRLYSC